MYRRKLITALAVGASCAGLIPAAMAGASTPPGSGGGGDYCAAHVALEAAFNGDDPSAIGPAVEAGTGRRHRRRSRTRSPRRSPTRRPTGRRVPSSSSPTTPSSTGSPPTAASVTLDIVATNYAYGGIADGDQIAAGITVLRLDNQADEYHEIDPVPSQRGHHRDARRAAGDVRRGGRTPRSPQVGAGFAAPGTVGGTVIDLAPGDYIGLCFIPKGTTQEVFDQMMAAEGSAPDGQRPDRHGRGGPAALHPRHARRVQRRRGWRRHDRLRLDDDDVDGHDAGTTTG